FVPAPGSTATSASLVYPQPAARPHDRNLTFRPRPRRRPHAPVPAGSQPTTQPSRSGEENRHQDYNDGDHRDGGLRQRHERAIHVLVTRVIVAPCCGVFELTVVVHRSPPGAILLGI